MSTCIDEYKDMRDAAVNVTGDLLKRCKKLDY